MALAPEPERAAVALVGVRGQRFCRLVRNFASLRSYLTFARDEFDRCDEVQSARVLHHRNRVAAAEAPAVESPELRIQGEAIVPAAVRAWAGPFPFQRPDARQPRADALRQGEDIGLARRFNQTRI